MSRLSLEKLAEIRQRHAAATPGPWTCDDAGRVFPPREEVVAPYADGTLPSLATVWAVRSPFVCENKILRIRSGSRATNTEAIAYSWEDVDLLLAEVDRLKAELVKAGGER